MIVEHTVDKEEVGKMEKLVTFENCKNCMMFVTHITAAKEARKGYKRDAKHKFEDNEIVLSVDLQKVIMLPTLPDLKSSIFCKRFVLFNESFVPVGSGKGKGLDVIWHEALLGRTRLLKLKFRMVV